MLLIGAPAGMSDRGLIVGEAHDVAVTGCPKTQSSVEHLKGALCFATERNAGATLPTTISLSPDAWSEISAEGRAAAVDRSYI